MSNAFMGNVFMGNVFMGNVPMSHVFMSIASIVTAFMAADHLPGREGFSEVKHTERTKIHDAQCLISVPVSLESSVHIFLGISS